MVRCLVLAGCDRHAGGAAAAEFDREAPIGLAAVNPDATGSSSSPRISDAMRQSLFQARSPRLTSRGTATWQTATLRTSSVTRHRQVLPEAKNTRIARAEAALGAGLIGDEHLAGEDVDHLVDAVLPAKAALGAGPGDHRHGAVAAAGDRGRLRLRAALQNPFRRERGSGELDGGGICGDDVLRHGGPLNQRGGGDCRREP